MRISSLCSGLAHIVSLSRINAASRRRSRFVRRRWSQPSLELLESRTLLAGITFAQLTDTADVVSSAPSINGDGTKVAFHSLGNLTGQNEDGNYEIFLFDSTTGSLTQVTDTLGHGYGGFPIVNQFPSIDNSGTRIAFQSAADLTGNNADANQEVFLYDATSNVFTQVTDTIGVSKYSFLPSISGDGTRIAFSSSGNLTGENADGNEELFFYDIGTASTTQITDTANGTGGFATTNRSPSISDDGIKIAFESNADLIGQNADQNPEIFLFDTSRSSLTQVTDGGGYAPSISGDGSTIAFAGRDIYVFDVATSTLTQVTNSPLDDKSGVTVNDDGTKIAFDSHGDLTGNNGDGGTEIFVFDTTTGTLTQVTDSPLYGFYVGSYRPSINADGSRIAHQFDTDSTIEFLEVRLLDTMTNELTPVTPAGARLVSKNASVDDGGARTAFESNADLTGGNLDGSREVFLLDNLTGDLTQVTDTPFAAPECPPGDINCINTFIYGESYDATISGDGTKVVFHAPFDLTGGNPDGNQEIFLFDALTSTLTQVTDSTAAANLDPSINSDASTIAFASNANLTGQNLDGNSEVFLFDINTRSFTQVTNTTAGLSRATDISGDGTGIAFVSSANLTGNNASGSFQIFLFDVPSASFTHVSEIANWSSYSFTYPSINADGTKVAFEYETLNVNHTIRLYDATTGTVVPVAVGTNPDINGNGTKIAFESWANLTGNNADQSSEIFVFDATNGLVTQVTAALDGNAQPGNQRSRTAAPSINSDGTKIALDSTANLAGDNADENSEIFLATIDYSVQDVLLFYNNSIHDGNGSAVTMADFNAIAPDKDPLQLGATAVFRNVSGYSRGINGLFIDVPNLPDEGAGIDASDLLFTVGDDNFLDAWAAAPAPTGVGVFANAGPGGADRIYVTFADQAIVDTWLGITVLATAGTGLDDPAAFFYGSARGDTGAAFAGQGNFFGRDAADMQSIVTHLTRRAQAGNANDVNRDGRVDAFDLQVIPVASGGGFTSNVLGAITPQAGSPPLAAAAVDEAVAEEDATEARVALPPNEDGLGRFKVPTDERVGREESTDRELAFATFAADKPVPGASLISLPMKEDRYL